MFGGASLDRFLGDSFWTTALRVSALFPMFALIPAVLNVALNPDELDFTVLIARSLLSIVSVGIVGSWIGWGLACWRHSRRPFSPGWVLLPPVLTGLLFWPTVILSFEFGSGAGVEALPFAMLAGIVHGAFGTLACRYIFAPLSLSSQLRRWET